MDLSKVKIYCLTIGINMSLISLPTELLSIIVEKCQINDWRNIALSCQTLNAAVEKSKQSFVKKEKCLYCSLPLGTFKNWAFAGELAFHKQCFIMGDISIEKEDIWTIIDFQCLCGCGERLGIGYLTGSGDHGWFFEISECWGKCIVEALRLLV